MNQSTLWRIWRNEHLVTGVALMVVDAIADRVANIEKV